MDNETVQQKCQAFLEELGASGFIVFGWDKGNDQHGVVYATHNAQPGVIMKGMTWALNDIAQKKL